MPEKTRDEKAAAAKRINPFVPKSSTASTAEAIGQFVTPPKNTVIPIAAQKPIGSPKTDANVAPRVAPMKNEGTISPPL